MNTLDKPELKQVLINQKEELQLTKADLKTRQRRHDLVELMDSRLAKVVIGIRRSGKSSLCLSVIQSPDVGYVNFDDERLLGITAKDLNRVLEVLLELNPKVKTFFFDEVQNVEGWELFINRLLRLKYNILVTGSSGKLLSSELSTHLTGRHISLTLYPLSFSEFLQWRTATPVSAFDEMTTSQQAQLAAHFDTYFKNGGFPQVIQGEPPGLYLRELFDKVINRDIVQRYELRRSKAIKELAAYLIQNSGQQVSIESLKKVFGISSVSMVQKYIQHLEDCFLIFELRTYSYKLKERSSAPRKIYACDLGMMTALWTKPTEDLGAKLETLVFLELTKRNKELYSLKESGCEVDFVVVEDRKITTMIQVCYNLKDPKTRQREIRALMSLAKKYRPRYLIIVTRDHRETITETNLIIECMPIYEFLLSP